MGRDGYYWSVDECRWEPCPEPVASQPGSAQEPVVAEPETT
jgi:hypothetical protein